MDVAAELGAEMPTNIAADMDGAICEFGVFHMRDRHTDAAKSGRDHGETASRLAVSLTPRRCRHREHTRTAARGDDRPWRPGRPGLIERTGGRRGASGGRDRSRRTGDDVQRESEEQRAHDASVSRNSPASRKLK